ncbi:MAG: 4-hydroxybenzoate octaprenyltransferase [Gammaproteobacteria bacterium]|nr:MAG: 4-hydroxybenzoate octaprenyltransferase [Gammaproteobacteria bacterium]PIE37838.1 MAG: 4-hydroxybenzoate octaprenyltransferase [Gammaproteobacteria bacterium]
MSIATLEKKLPAYIALTRLDRPIGIYLLMWPMLWALWFAAGGLPRFDVLVIFIAGAVLTRSAGCAINDFADRDFDGHVARTKQRPLATGALSAREAVTAAAILFLAAFVLVLFTNPMTIGLSFVAVALASFYPFAKRVTDFPQIVLGAAFGIAVPMAFAAQTSTLPPLAWLLYAATLLWALAYDTLYAMADRADDLRIGVRSTAVRLGHLDLAFVLLIQLAVLALLALAGHMDGRGSFYHAGLLAALGFIAWQLWISRERDPQACLHAFLNNHWMGLTIFLGLVLDFALGS